MVIVLVSSVTCLLLGIAAGRVIQARQTKTEKQKTARELAEITEEKNSLREKNAGLEATIDAGNISLAETKEERDHLRKEKDTLTDEYSKLKNSTELQKVQFKVKEEAWEEKIKLLETAEKQLTQQFEITANRIFRNETKAFKESSKEQITQLLTPFREQIDGLHKDVKNASKERHTLSSEIEKIVTETSSLTRALKGDTKQQGDWGEFLLESILENTGLRKGMEYELQSGFTADDGTRQRPDAIIHLPENRDIIIDSKVSLTDYEKYVNAENDSEREIHLSAHVASVKRHIRQLAGKNYEDIPNLRTLDYTLMWLPIESAYFAAVQADNGLIGMAMKERVIPVSATTLFAVLKVIEKIWQSERQNTNVKNIIDRANQLYDKFAGFIKAFNEIGASLEQAQISFGTAKGRLESGRGNVMRQFEMLLDLGLNPRNPIKRLPDGPAQTPDTPVEHDDPAQDPPGS